ncbi:MAG TPA: DUF4446 family protein, partial [Candidatus Limnocylindrales bacterium]|nr:DUF4446 family protein [Candidatus Limnocylindrales bacterium]
MDLDTIVRSNLDAIVVAFAIALLVVLLLLVLQARRASRLGQRLDRLTGGADGASLEALLGQNLERVRAVMAQVDRLDGRTGKVESELRTALGHVGLVRYNPFEDTGGQLSFALAILDGAGNGFVVNSLHARQGTRVYAKAISGGRAALRGRAAAG